MICAPVGRGCLRRKYFGQKKSLTGENTDRIAYIEAMKAASFPCLLGVFALCQMAGTARATDHEVDEFAPILETCYQDAGTAEERRACQGSMSEICMEQDGGHTTLGMTSCLNAEAEVWDRFLNREYQATQTWMAAADTDEAENFPEFARRAETLRTAQRAWIAFRDAECDLAYAQWGSGSMRNIAWADCRRGLTADRAIELRNMREVFE